MTSGLSATRGRHRNAGAVATRFAEAVFGTMVCKIEFQPRPLTDSKPDCCFML